MPRPVIFGALVGLCLAAAGVRARTSMARARIGKATTAPTAAAKTAVIAIDDYVPIVRGDGSRQWVFKSRKLHRIAQDKALGDFEGDEILNTAWPMANPK